MNKQTVMYKPIGIVGGVLAGAIAGAAFKQVWRVASGSREAPHATDRTKGMAEILVAAAVQGAIFGLVKAAVDRGGAHAVKSLTGRWPD
ncbi:DUF4235 domain-containing protein [Catellatospora bangladeshensis]|uniref:Membrane protein n=1 Tax=Catellatospora bangladeshensis TaxID=310355 RepID=A0A8J3NK90_9ACTN|nr:MULTISPECIES: DUF4235 domain-containing protein [Catellatospora]BCJ76518.1 membrane protein [Catellatospora sp. IY07-71]GIF84175.1 membrane protein [Catellatospora bangladeshensis]